MLIVIYRKTHFYNVINCKLPINRFSSTGSEWLLHNANSAIFAAKSWREQVNFQWDDDEIHFVLDQHA